ncbi:MAG TPA: 5'-nucleotidase C-terminal domain-containing protein, partial [Polyangiaceae bacterium]
VLSKAAFVSALPFGDSLTVLQLSGAELTALFGKQAALAGSRGCQSPFQGSGFNVSIDCTGGASHLAALRVAGAAVVSSNSYSLVTTEYLAENGAGFPMGSHLSSRVALDRDPLDVLLGALGQRTRCGKPALPCLDPATLRDGRISVQAP